MKVSWIMKMMKNISVMGYRLWVIGMLVVLGAAEVHAVRYDSYRPSGQSTMQSPSMATTPQSGFQSTSVFSDQWATREREQYIREDGTVNDGAYGIGRRPGLRKDPIAPPPNPDDPDEPGSPDPDDPGNVPVGDGVWVLLLGAAVYAVWRRRTRTLGY